MGSPIVMAPAPTAVWATPNKRRPILHARCVHSFFFIWSPSLLSGVCLPFICKVKRLVAKVGEEYRFLGEMSPLIGRCGLRLPLPTVEFVMYAALLYFVGYEMRRRSPVGPRRSWR